LECQQRGHIKKLTQAVRLIENNTNVGLLLEGQAGEYAFCRDCEQYENCNHNGQKILSCNKLVIDHMYADEYYWGTKLYDEAEWFIELLNIAKNTRAKVRKENANRRSKN